MLATVSGAENPVHRIFAAIAPERAGFQSAYRSNRSQDSEPIPTGIVS